jgi:hypothetical protein
MAVLVLLCCGCQGSIEERDAPQDRRAGVSTVDSVAPESARRDVIATRLVGGPIVLRVNGATHEPLLRYVLIFRLNHPYPKWPEAPDDPDGPAPLPDGAADPLGNYAIERFAFDFSYSIFDFDPVRGRDQDNCFAGRISTDVPDARLLRRLDAIPDGGRVRVHLHPLTSKRNGTPAWGRNDVRHPRIVPTRVRSIDNELRGYRDRAGDGLYLEVVSPGARRALKHTGCAATVL